MKKTISILSLVASLFASAPANALYQLLDLSFLENPSIYTNAYSNRLNDSNTVAGYASVGGNYKPSFWTESLAQNIMTLGGDGGMAFGVNNAGQIVGWSDLPTPNTWHATLWDSAGNATDLKGIDASRNSEAFAINNAGNAVGWSFNSSGQSHATLWSGSNIIDLGSVSGYSESEAYGINASNQIVGLSMNGANRSATLWSYDGSNVSASNLGSGEAYAINDSGTIVGISGDSAVFWNGGSMNTLSNLGGIFSNAYDINNAGQIVGNSTDASGNYHGVLWSSGNIFDLTSLLDQPLIDADWIITDAFSINESGNILAYAKDAQGNEKTVLLFTASAAAVPETSTSLMLLIGLCLVGFKRTRFKHFA